MNDMAMQTETETIYRRLSDSLSLFGRELNPQWWLAIIIPVVVVGLFFVAWMYIKDSRSVGWKWALPLGLLRAGVYGVLVYVFLLPAKQTWEKVEKKSRVLVVLDISESMTKTSDELPGSRVSSRPQTRIQKVIDFLTDEKVNFIKRMLDSNPVYVYRLGSRLDEESQLLEKSVDGKYLPFETNKTNPNGVVERVFGKEWKSEDWNAFVNYDFKPWLVRGLSEDGKVELRKSPAFDGDTPGTVEWARKWLDNKDAVPGSLSETDKTILLSNREKLEVRIDVAGSIASATNVPESLLSAVNREAGGMVQGIVLFSDGQSNLGSSSVIQELRARAKRESIPIFTVAVGEERKSISIRITDVQAPDQTPPDEPFKVIVEVDGEGLVGQTRPVQLELLAPDGKGTTKVTGDVTFQPGEPPHGQVEFILDPEKLPEELKSEKNRRELIEGDWKARAIIAREKDEIFADKEHLSEWANIRVEKRPLRVLLFASGPSRDFQFLLTQLVRDKADLSVFLQNEGAMAGKAALLDDPERVLTRFPTRLKVDDDPKEDPKERWYNLARYDVIIAFDPDWAALPNEQLSLLRTWVDLQAGGLFYIAGPLYTKLLARPDDTGKYTPLLDIMPVVLGDPDLAAIKRDTKSPWRLTFENVGPDTDYLRLDDEKPDDPLAGWEPFFTGKDKYVDGAKTLRGFYNYFPVKEVKPGASTVARFSDPNAMKTPDGKAAPFLVTLKYGQGMTAFLGSSEVWRLRQYQNVFFERFWVKLSRFLASGSRKKQNRRGRILMSKEFSSGSYIRLSAQLLDPSLQPVNQNAEPKMVLVPVELDKYPPQVEAAKDEVTITREKEKIHQKLRKELKLTSKKGPEVWSGMFQKSVLALSEQYPTGTWRLEVEIPNSTESLKQKFTIRRSNPELDQTRPDFASLIAMAGELDEVVPRIPDKQIASRLKDMAASGPEGKKLAFKFDRKEALELIPDCMISDTKTLRNRGAVDDLWDKGIELPQRVTSWYDRMLNRPPQTHFIGTWMLIVVGLLSVEWMTRKLLKLA